MKIEKVNDHQIRCTLTKADLIDRELKISELAYGTEKAKSLFRDMMQQASYEFGFEAEDIPLMIEAIPLNADCIVLIITKVEDPEELDTRFAKFAPSIHNEENKWENDEADSFAETEDSDSTEEVLDLFKKLQDTKLGSLLDSAKDAESSSVKAASTEKKAESVSLKPVIRLYSFDSFQHVVRAARVLNSYYQDSSSLYKDNSSGSYKLVLLTKNSSSSDFNKVCNILAEYGHPSKFNESGMAYLEEHFECLCKDTALSSLLLI